MKYFAHKRYTNTTHAQAIPFKKNRISRVNSRIVKTFIAIIALQTVSSCSNNDFTAITDENETHRNYMETSFSENKLKSTVIRCNKRKVEFIQSGDSINSQDSQSSVNASANIVFFNGFRMNLSSWNTVFNGVSSKGKASLVAYNRAGVGSSSKADKDQTSEQIIEDFREFAQCANISPPYVLVSHSLGGLHANYYARKYADEVAAVVFVDASHPSEIALQKQLKVPFLLNMLNNGLKGIEKTFNKYKYSEDEVVQKSVDQIDELADFPDIPITVISGTKKLPFVPEEGFAIHLEHQTELLKLSQKSTQVLANDSNHFPQASQPEIVIEAILDIMERI